MSRFRWVRVASVAVRPVSGGDYYDLTLDLTPGAWVDDDFLFEGSEDVPGDSSWIGGSTTALFQPNTAYNFTVTATRISGTDTGYAWSWTIATSPEVFNVAADYDDSSSHADWPQWADNTTGPHTYSGTFTTPPDLDNTMACGFYAAEALSSHGTGVWRWTFSVTQA